MSWRDAGAQLATRAPHSAIARRSVVPTIQCLSWLLALVVSLLAFTAGAQPSAADRETARQLLYDGDRLREQGDLQGALRAFEAADAILHTPTTGVEVGRTLVLMGRLVEARGRFLRVARHPVRTESAELAEAMQLAEELRARLPTLTVEVTGASDDLVVSIDGELVENASLGLPRVVDPGTHVVVATTRGRRLEESVELLERGRRTLRFDFRNRADRLARHERSGPAPWVVMGIGGASLVAGAILGGVALDAADDLAAICPELRCGPDAHDDVDRAAALAHASTATLALGAAAIVVGGVLYVTLPGKVTVAPSAAPTAAGVVVTGRF